MKRILRSFFLLLLVIAWSSNALAQETLSVDFESKLATYTDWKFSNIVQSKAITAHGGTFYGNTNGKTTAFVQTKNIIAAPQQLTFYFSKESGNDNKNSFWKIQVSSNGSKWSDVKSVKAAPTKDVGVWTEVTQSLTEYTNVYVRVYYSGTSAIRCIDDVTLTYKAASSATATTVSFPKESLNLIDGDEAAQGQNATVKAGEKTLTGATVTYSFESADGIFNETSDGIFSLNAGTYGTGKVTATFAGGEIDGVTYAKSSASYIVNYSAAKTPALTFSAAKVTVKQGEEASFVKPTITFTDKRGDDITAAADIIYVASPETVVKLDNEGNVTQWLAPGVATITATTEYGNNYYDASYTLTYEKVKLATTLTLNEGLKTTGEIGETLDCPAWTLKAGETVLSGKTVELTSDNGDVVKVDGNQLQLVAAGSANISLIFKGDDDYQSSNVSYKLTVVDPNAAEVTFDFTDPASLQYSNIVTTNLKEGDKFVKEPISLTNKKNGSNTPNRLFKSTSGFYLGVYQEGQMELSAAEGYAITGISFTKEGKTLKINGVLPNADWSGNAKSLILSVDATAAGTRIKTMTVAYSKLPSIDLDESQNNAETISGNADKTVNVKLTRTLKADVWNTFCVPFDVTVAGSPLEGATIKQIASVAEKTDGAGAVINFEDAPATLEAGKAYLVRTATAIVNPTFNGVTVKNVDPTNCSGNENYQLIGIYSPLNIDASLYGKVFGINNQDKLAKVKQDTSIKGMRAYFLLANSAAAAKLNFGGELTGIDAVDNGEAVMTGKVYNLNGQYVGNSLEGLKKGVYVVNGKKVLK